MSKNTFDEIKDALETGSSFIMEAGAGSGKTYTLIQTVNFLLENKSTSDHTYHSDIDYRSSDWVHCRHTPEKTCRRN